MGFHTELITSTLSVHVCFWAALSSHSGLSLIIAKHATIRHVGTKPKNYQTSFHTKVLSTFPSHVHVFCWSYICSVQLLNTA